VSDFETHPSGTAERIERLTQILTDAHSMLLWCERRMVSPSISSYPRELAVKIERILNEQSLL
jgi:hypothetical protein